MNCVLFVKLLLTEERRSILVLNVAMSHDELKFFHFGLQPLDDLRMAVGQISAFAQITAKVEEKRVRVLDGGLTLASVGMRGTILGAEMDFIIT